MKKTIGDRIRERRNAMDMTLEQVGKLAGVNRATIQRYENGVIQNIPSDRIEAIARALNTTPSYLMGWAQADPFTDDEVLEMNELFNEYGLRINLENPEDPDWVITYDGRAVKVALEDLQDIYDQQHGKTDQEIRDEIESLVRSERPSGLDQLEEEFPDGVSFIRRANKALTPAGKKRMIELMKLFVEEVEAENERKREDRR